MRWYILRTLLYKELLRQLADRGGIFLALLLVTATMLLSFVGRADKNASAGDLLTGGPPKLFYVDYWEKDSPWIEHLKNNKPKDIKVEFRSLTAEPDAHARLIMYRVGTAAVQVRVKEEKDKLGRPQYLVRFWQPGKDPSDVAPLAEWFWRETQRYFRQRTPLAIEAVEEPPMDRDERWLVEVRPLGKDAEGRMQSRFVFWPTSSGGDPTPFEKWLSQEGQNREPLSIEVRREEMTGTPEWRTVLASAFVFFAIWIFCVYLLPTLTCEERERGVLLAQALSPASTLEILAAKFLFYSVLGIGLAAVLAGIYRPALITLPFFWLCLFIIGIGYLGVGLTIASLAQTQRKASLGALFYMLSVALLSFICQQNGIPILPWLALEFHAPRMLHAALADQVTILSWLHLIVAAFLATGWAVLAGFLFRRRGWQ